MGRLSHLLTFGGQQWCKKSPLSGIAGKEKKQQIYVINRLNQPP